MIDIADESLTKQICPVTQNTSYETTALSFVIDIHTHLYAIHRCEIDAAPASSQTTTINKTVQNSRVHACKAGYAQGRCDEKLTIEMIFRFDISCQEALEISVHFKI